MKRKSFFYLAACLLFLVVIIASHRTFIAFGLTEFIKTKSSSLKTLRVNFHKIHFHKWKVCFEDVEIFQKNQDTDEIIATVKNITVQYTFRKKSKSSPYIISIYHPEINVTKLNLPKKEAFSLERAIRSLEALPDVKVVDATINFSQKETASALKASVEISAQGIFNGDIRVGESGRLEFKSTPITPHKKKLTLASYDIPLKWIQEIHANLQEGSKFLEGSMDADISCVITSEYQVEECLGQVAISDVSYADMLALHDVKMKKWALLFHQPSAERSFDLDEFLTPSTLWKSLSLDFQLNEAEATLTHPVSQSKWNISCTRGTLKFDALTGTFVEGYGELLHDGCVQQYALAGSGAIESEKNLWVDLELKTRLESKTNTTEIFFSILEDGNYYFKTSLNHLNDQHIASYQEWLSIFFPSIADVNIHKADVTCDVTIEFKEACFYKLSLDKLEMQHVEGDILDKHTTFSLDYLKGKLRYYNPLHRYSNPASWDVAFDKLKLLTYLDERVVSLKDAHGSISSKQGMIAPSKIAANYSGFIMELDFEGSFDDISLNMHVTHDPVYPLELLEREVLSSYEGIQKIISLDISAHVKEAFTHLHASGSLHLTYEDTKRETVTFGLQLPSKVSESIIASSYWKGVTPSGWFQSDELSEDAYLWLLRLSKQNWNVFGKLKITGEFNSSSIGFTMATALGCFDSSDVRIQAALSEASGLGQFYLDIPKNKWRIQLPLKEASCDVKKFDMHYDHITTSVLIDGAIIEAKNIQCESEHLKLRGDLDLNLIDPLANKLSIAIQGLEGDVSSLQKFLRHIPELAWMDVPFEGKVTSIGDNSFVTTYSLENSQKDVNIQLNIKEGHMAISKYAALTDMQMHILWDSKQGYLEVKDIHGILKADKEDLHKDYTLKVPTLKMTSLQDYLADFDLRLENSTHDVLRVMGSTYLKSDGLHIAIDEHLSHLFNSKIKLEECLLDKDFHVNRLAISTEIIAQDIGSKLEWMYLLGILDLSKASFDTIKLLKYEGDLKAELLYRGDDDLIRVNAYSKALLINKIPFEDLSLSLDKHGSRVCLKQLSARDIDLKASGNIKGSQWTLDDVKIRWKGSFLESQLATCDLQEKKLTITLDKAHLCVQELMQLSSQDDMPMIKEHLAVDIEGKCFFDFSAGFNTYTCIHDIELSSCNLFSEKKLAIFTSMPFELRRTSDGKWHFHRLALSLSHEDEENLYSLLKVDDLYVASQEMQLEAKAVKWILPPEMFQYIAKAEMIPFLTSHDDCAVLAGKEFKWDNQIEGCFDISYKQGNFSFKGSLKEGYYWICNKSFYFKNIALDYYHDVLKVDCSISYQDLALDISAKADMSQPKSIAITLKETHPALSQDEKAALTVLCKDTVEGDFYVHSIMGKLYGIDFSFQHNPKTYVPHVMMLTGQMKIDTSGLVKAFPKLFFQTVKDLGMGSGYELSGDWVISKQELASSYFKGFLKGRDFDFMGYHLKTLLSEVDISSKHVIVHDFSLSDKSGVIQIKEVKIEKTEDALWKMHIPEVHVQDFRPSFLKRSEIDEESLKPFVIKDLHFYALQGVIGDKDSFTGRGYLDFINTFKRDYHLLDIPIEIIGRIGFDLGLFVPVRGQVDVELTHGKLYIKELKNAYSEGKRSRFYLSNYQPSFVDLDGSLMIDIKMKQYVLLKITEPFTLSIRGNLAKPKYSLR